jgi:transcriptional regulator GlxA family with amidase domain
MASLFKHGCLDDLAKLSGYNARKLADLCSISVRQLEREFHKTFGNSPQKWLDEQRIRAAERLLLKGTAVKNVAFELGYKQCSHFCRRFKEQNFLTPSQFVSTFEEAKCR